MHRFIETGWACGGALASKVALLARNRHNSSVGQTMPRAPYNVLVIPYRLVANGYEFAVFHRSDDSIWQFIAGGAEGDEVPLSAAQREAWEEGGISTSEVWIALDSKASIPRTAFPDADWPSDVYVVPEFCFAVDVRGAELRLSGEHDRFAWLDPAAAAGRLTWDSNRVALWELTERLKGLSNKPLGGIYLATETT